MTMIRVLTSGCMEDNRNKGEAYRNDVIMGSCFFVSAIIAAVLAFPVIAGVALGIAKISQKLK